MYNYIPFGTQRDDYEQSLSKRKKGNIINQQTGTEDINNLNNIPSRKSSLLSDYEKSLFAKGAGSSTGNHYDVSNNEEKFESTLDQNDHTRLHLNSSARNRTLYPCANDFTITFPTPISRIKYMKAEQVNLPDNLYNITEDNNVLYFSQAFTTNACISLYSAVIPPGFYTNSTLVTQINALLSVNVQFLGTGYMMSGIVYSGSPPIFIITPTSPTPVPTIYGPLTIQIDSNSGQVLFLGNADGTSFNTIFAPVRSATSMRGLSTSEVSTAKATCYISVSIQQGIVLTVDVITIVTKEITNIGNNCMFNLTLIGDKGTIMVYTNMVNMWVPSFSSLMPQADVLNRSFSFMVDSTDPTVNWPFYPATGKTEIFKSGTITPFSALNNIADVIGLTYTQQSGNLNKIINLTGGTSDNTNVTIITKYPHGQSDSTPNTRTSVVYDKVYSGPYLEISPTTPTNNLITLQAVSIPTTLDRLRTGYVSCMNVVLTYGCANLYPDKEIFIRMTLDSNRDVGNITTPTSDIHFFAKTRYMTGLLSTIYFEVDRLIGEETFKIVYSKAKSIRLRLYTEAGNLVYLDSGQEWSFDLLLSGRMT